MVLAAALLGAACTRETPVPPAPAQTPRPSPSPDHSAFVAAVDALAADALERGPAAGLSIAVYAKGHPVLAKGYGFTDVEAKTPATADTSYPIASVSKHLTAAAILRLVDQGRVSLDDPLSRFFPRARPVIGALVIRNLLEHTTGLTKSGPAPRDAAVSVLARGGTGRQQGQSWTYSNYNFSLLGLVIEQVSGRDYATYVREELAAPLGLTGTGYCEDGVALPGRGRDYLSGPGTLTATGYWAERRFFAGGGLCSTVLDLVKFVSALEAGRVISPAMLQAMRSPARLPDGLEAGYGLGTRLGFTGNRRKIGHTGGGQGNKAVLARYPDDDVTIVVLLNSERVNAPVTANGLEDSVARLFFGEAEAAPASLEAGRYVGQYVDGSRLVRIGTDGGALVARPGVSQHAQSRFVPRGGDVFVAEDAPTYELRFQVQQGRARGYGRYRNGWFTSSAVRSDTAADPSP